MEKRQFIDEFIGSVKVELNGINIGYQYMDMDDEYRIWHNYEEFENIEFRNSIGKLIKNYLLANKVYNFYITFERRQEFLGTNCKTRNLYESHHWKSSGKSMSENYLVKQDSKLNFLAEEIENSINLIKAIPTKQIEMSNIYNKGDLAA